MSLWTWLQNTPPSTPSVPNDNPPETVTGGDPDGVDLTDFDNLPASRALPRAVPSAWSGWPSEWSTPAFTAQLGINKLVDIAWAALDLNSSILSSMPVYRLRGGQIIDPATWMVNPDPAIYTSWQEFCKQLLWDYMLGEVFVLPIVRGADGWPMRFRVIPPWLIEVEMRGGTREYKLGSVDVTNDILHIRYTSSTDNARGVGPLQCAGARQTTIGLLQRYSNRLAETGGTLKEWFNVDRRINRSEAADLMESYIESRTKYAGYPGLVGSGATLNQGQSMSATDMALLELSQFNESRIAVLLGVSPFLLGLSGASGSLTYANVESLFSSHERASLRPKADACMAALSGWALPAGQTIELNRDEYTRPNMLDRANAYKVMIESGVMTAEEVRTLERLHGQSAPAQISGAS